MVSQDHLLRQTRREPGRVEETDIRKVVSKEHLRQEGHSMVSPRGQLSPQPGLLGFQPASALPGPA